MNPGASDMPGLALQHDGEADGEVAENCCLCRNPTRYWHASGVALCRGCAQTADEAALPSKKEWCDKERELMNRSRFVVRF